MGVPFVEDFNDPKQPASSITKLRTTVNTQGRRSSTSDAFLSEKDVKSKHNLTICLGAVVQRVHLDDRKQVRGVFVEAETPSPETYYISVEKEIILCGGAVASPQLLALRLSLEMHANNSGIGPKDELAKHNIPCIVDLSGIGVHLVIPRHFVLTCEARSYLGATVLFSSCRVIHSRPPVKHSHGGKDVITVSHLG